MLALRKYQAFTRLFLAAFFLAGSSPAALWAQVGRAVRAAHMAPAPAPALNLGLPALPLDLGLAPSLDLQPSLSLDLQPSLSLDLQPSLSPDLRSARAPERTPGLAPAPRLTAAAARALSAFRETQEPAALHRIFEGARVQDAVDAAALSPERFAPRAHARETGASASAVPALSVAGAATASTVSGGLFAAGGFALGAIAAGTLWRAFDEKLKLSKTGYGAGLFLSVLTGGGLTAWGMHALAQTSPALAAAAFGAAVVLEAILLRRPVFERVRARREALSSNTLFGLSETDAGYLLRVKRDQLEKPFMLAAALEQGPNTDGLWSATLQNDVVVQFRKTDDQLQLVARNLDFRATPGSPAERAIRHSFSDTILAALDIQKEHSTDDYFAIDLEELFLQDLFDFRARVNETFNVGEGYSVNKKASRVPWARAYAHNIEAAAQLVFSGLDAVEHTRLSDARNVAFNLRYSLIALPDDAYAPRPADERVGYFTTIYQDWSNPVRGDKHERLIQRWKLEKLDPAAEVSPVKEPIVWVLDPSVPVEYRDAVKRGILAWNKAFERVGLQDAIVVRDAPEETAEAEAAPARRGLWQRLLSILPEWLSAELRALDEALSGASPERDPRPDYDPADARYNVFRWAMFDDSMDMAYAPYRADPRTGRIFHAGVTFSPGLLPTEEVFDLADGTARRSRSDAAKTKACGPGCRAAAAAKKGAAFALAARRTRGVMGGAERDAFIQSYVQERVMHEVGHTLGLRHNFAASEYRSLREIAEADDGVISGSVMAYNDSFLAAPGQKQGPHHQTELGPYDYWAIEYGYTQDPSRLAAIAARAGEPGLSYATDEDLSNMDPHVGEFTLGNDPLASGRRRVALARMMWRRLETRELAPGEPYTKLRGDFLLGYNEYWRAVEEVLPLIGGVRFRRTRAGDAHQKSPFETIPIERQRAALEFLKTKVFSDDPFKASGELLAKLAPSRNATLDDDSPELEPLGYNAMIGDMRQAALDHIYDLETLTRLTESENFLPAGAEIFSVEELFATTLDAAWTELFARPRSKASWLNISSTRRRLQAMQVTKLIDLYRDYENTPIEVRAVARRDLKRILARINTVKPRRKIAAVRAHLEETAAHIKAALDVSYD